ncbi:hypothetical protein PMV52_03530 [Eggerthella lenta]|uniref:hypothetical protein n=1 Tax=Eggerthella lenta TaxID=84112 RepID=UPI00189A3A8D|nr:hypothetical protein [Eggerthella lenta]MDB1792520.1 hypothetical protein [Eggerthella lenta]
MEIQTIFGHSAVHFIQKLVAQLFPEHALQGLPHLGRSSLAAVFPKENLQAVALQRLPERSPQVFVVQHLPEQFFDGLHV